MYNALYIAKVNAARMVVHRQPGPMGQSKRTRLEFDAIKESIEPATAELHRTVNAIFALSGGMVVNSPRSILNRAIVKYINSISAGVPYTAIILLREIVDVISESIMPGTETSSLLLRAFVNARKSVEKDTYWMKHTFIKRPPHRIIEELLDHMAAIGANVRQITNSMAKA